MSRAFSKVSRLATPRIASIESSNKSCKTSAEDSATSTFMPKDSAWDRTSANALAMSARRCSTHPAIIRADALEGLRLPDRARIRWTGPPSSSRRSFREARSCDRTWRAAVSKSSPGEALGRIKSFGMLATFVADGRYATRGLREPASDEKRRKLPRRKDRQLSCSIWISVGFPATVALLSFEIPDYSAYTLNHIPEQPYHSFRPTIANSAGRNKPGAVPATCLL